VFWLGYSNWRKPQKGGGGERNTLERGIQPIWLGSWCHRGGREKGDSSDPQINRDLFVREGGPSQGQKREMRTREKDLGFVQRREGSGGIDCEVECPQSGGGKSHGGKTHVDGNRGKGPGVRPGCDLVRGGGKVGST